MKTRRVAVNTVRTLIIVEASVVEKARSDIEEQSPLTRGTFLIPFSTTPGGGITHYASSIVLDVNRTKRFKGASQTGRVQFISNGDKANLDAVPLYRVS